MICKPEMMENLQIQPVTTTDLEVLREIGIATFTETFGPHNAKAQMDRYIVASFDADKIQAEFENPESLFFFGKIGTSVAGYLKLNWGSAQTEAEDPRAVEIERIYVLADFHGKKLGQLLFEKAREIALEKKAPYLWLGVWEKNQRAIRFYEKNGFRPFGQHVFTLGDDVQTDIMMKQILN